MNIFQIIDKSIKLTFENKGNLAINNLFFLMSIFISFGIFCSFFLVGVFGSFLFTSNKVIYLAISLGAFLVGLITSMSVFFACRGVYFYFIAQTLTLKKRFNLIEELELLDKNFVRYCIGGWIENFLFILNLLVIFISLIILKNEIFQILLIFFSSLVTFILYPYLWLILPGVVLTQKSLLMIVGESISIVNKYIIQSLIILAILGIIKLIGVVLLIAYPLYLILFFYPVFGYTTILFYRAAK